MLRSAPLAPILTAFILPLLAGCATSDERDYPRLLPLSELNAPPAIPAHAAEAAANPQAVGAALEARRDAARRRADATGGPVTDARALSDRAAALRRRADALAATELPPSGQAATPEPASQTEAPAAGPDPDTAARLRALRERARALGEQPVGALPACPPGTADPVAARCNPR